MCLGPVRKYDLDLRLCALMAALSSCGDQKIRAAEWKREVIDRERAREREINNSTKLAHRKGSLPEQCQLAVALGEGTNPDQSKGNIQGKGEQLNAKIISQDRH